jgi:hypothetical protein
MVLGAKKRDVSLCSREFHTCMKTGDWNAGRGIVFHKVVQK